MNLIQALRLPNSQAVMTNIARFHYQNIYNISLSSPIVTQSKLTFQIKGYTRNYRFRVYVFRSVEQPKTTRNIQA